MDRNNKKFRPVFLEVKNIPEAYTRGMWYLMKDGRVVPVDAGSFKGHLRLQFDSMTMVIENPFVLPMIPDVPPGVAVPTDGKTAEEYTSELLAGSKTDSRNLAYTYGDYIRGQMEWYIKHFKEVGFSNNHCFITVGDPESYRAYDEEDEGKKHSPCLRGIDLKIIAERLSMGFIFRSWDFYSGFPNNVYALAMMQLYIADAIGIETGSMVINSMGLHVYDMSWDSMAGLLKCPLADDLKVVLENHVIPEEGIDIKNYEIIKEEGEKNDIRARQIIQPSGEK